MYVCVYIHTCTSLMLHATIWDIFNLVNALYALKFLNGCMVYFIFKFINYKMYIKYPFRRCAPATKLRSLFMSISITHIVMHLLFFSFLLLDYNYFFIVFWSICTKIFQSNSPGRPFPPGQGCLDVHSQGQQFSPKIWG